MNIKRLLALVMVCVLLIPMTLQSFALSVDDTVAANWNAMAAKYSKGTWKIIAPKANGNKIKTPPFSENGGVFYTFMRFSADSRR